MTDSLPQNDFAEIIEGPLSFDSFYRRLGQPVTNQDKPSELRESGAIVTFSGVVRETEEGNPIPALHYEHYAGMAEQEMQKLILCVREKWDLQRVGQQHRVGRVAVGESSVLVGVCAGHREEAFSAARWLIDTFKSSVPIWKSLSS
jgi:molybdopterin synthase catalytic subunit